ncbi:MAG: glycoside hydrolase family 9 protein [Planctomycetota bacterium]|nr:glycoside hydrolase family 9 protein [Planctomycetota bacterium]
MNTTRFSIVMALLGLTCGWCQTLMAAPSQILVNHLGYEPRGAKRFVVQSSQEIELAQFQVLDGEGRVAFEGPLQKVGKVDGWTGRFFHQGDFSTLVQPGTYRIRVKDALSESFAIRERLLPESCLADMIYYFRSQRSSGVYDKADRSLPVFGEPRQQRMDVHGGWYDASGDVSKYLGCQGKQIHAIPQQSPMAVWCFLQAAELLKAEKSVRLRTVVSMLHEEALYGADFLVRMQDPSGFFYTSVLDEWSWDPARREIRGRERSKDGRPKADFRAGGGMAIAALAWISSLKQSGDYTPAQYLAAAEKGFKHLLIHNLEYGYDRRENIISDYCILLAATELYGVTKNTTYLDAARARAESLVKRISKDDKYAGWWRADEEGTVPFFHLSDAGLPVVALFRYLQFETDASRKAAVEKATTASLQFELAITKEVANPFGYARQYVKAVDGKRGVFFVPHHSNETDSWWQGENARLASLAAAAMLGGRIASPEMSAELKIYAGNQINWILGLNPFDVCMLHGKGRNNPDCEPRYPHAPGGISNGITSGVKDEQDIAFLPGPYGRRGDWCWRWEEQWIPHAAWMVLALAAEATVTR